MLSNALRERKRQDMDRKRRDVMRRILKKQVSATDHLDHGQGLAVLTELGIESVDYDTTFRELDSDGDGRVAVRVFEDVFIKSKDIELGGVDRKMRIMMNWELVPTESQIKKMDALCMAVRLALKVLTAVRCEGILTRYAGVTINESPFAGSHIDFPIAGQDTSTEKTALRSILIDLVGSDPISPKDNPDAPPDNPDAPSDEHEHALSKKLCKRPKQHDTIGPKDIPDASPDEYEYALFKKLCKRLRQQLEECPRATPWAQTLKKYGFEWRDPPKRCEKGALNKWLNDWVDTDVVATDSALFNSTGVWSSKNYPIVLFFVGVFLLAFGAQEWYYVALAWRQQVGCTQFSNGYCIANFTTLIALGSFNTLHGFIALTSAMFSYLRRKHLSRGVLGASVVTFPGFAVFAARAVLCQCMGEFFKDFSPQYSIGWLVPGIVYPIAFGALVIWPQFSFYALFFALVIILLGAGTATILNDKIFGPLIYCLDAFFLVLGLVYLHKRKQRLLEAEKVTRKDEAKYSKSWEHICSHEGERLNELLVLWDSAMKSAQKSGKNQTADNLEELYLQADLLNPLLQTKIAAIATKYDARSQLCPVKTEARALQKTWRSYNGEWKRLCDLVRTSIICDTVLKLNQCLELLSKDPELIILRVSDDLRVINDKMRLRVDYDGKKSCGYRDIQLSVKLRTAEAKNLGLDDHVSEVQLHLREVFDVKSDEGHEHYVRSRSLRGQ